MFPKKNRADKKAINEIFKKGLFFGSRAVNIKYFIKKDFSEPQISILVPKTTEKGAVRRNYLRRRGYLILKSYLSLIPKGFLGVVILNKPAATLSKMETDQNIKEILKKIKI